MNSAKSTNLIQTRHNLGVVNNKKVLVLKPAIDTKSEKVVSRIGVEAPVDINVTPDLDVYDAIKNAGELDAVLVEEAQFLNAEQVMQLLKIATLLDITVIAYGLRVDAFANAFEGASQLMAVAHKINEFETFCECGCIATMNARYANGSWQKSGNQVAIDDGSVKYLALCSVCYDKYVGL
jgi:thymidine kinase